MDTKKKETEAEQKKVDDANYAYTPKVGFNWDDVSGAMDEVL